MRRLEDLYPVRVRVLEDAKYIGVDTRFIGKEHRAKVEVLAMGIYRVFLSPYQCLMSSNGPSPEIEIIEESK